MDTRNLNPTDEKNIIDSLYEPLSPRSPPTTIPPTMTVEEYTTQITNEMSIGDIEEDSPNQTVENEQPEFRNRSEEGEMEAEPKPEKSKQDNTTPSPVLNKRSGLFGFSFFGGMVVLSIGGIVILSSYYLKNRFW